MRFSSTTFLHVNFHFSFAFFIEKVMMMTMLVRNKWRRMKIKLVGIYIIWFFLSFKFAPCTCTKVKAYSSTSTAINLSSHTTKNIGRGKTITKVSLYWFSNIYLVITSDLIFIPHCDLWLWSFMGIYMNFWMLILQHTACSYIKKLYWWVSSNTNFKI